MSIAANGKEKKVYAAEGIPVMIREIYQNYHLPMNPKELSLEDLHFWYDPLMPSLIRMQKEILKSNRRT